MAFCLLASVFVIATCGLIYELIAGALASYLLGDSVTQFSTIIGAYLFAMGIGSFLSKYVQRNLLAVFIQVELMVGLVGGGSAALLFIAFEHVTAFRVLLYSLVGLTGILVGLEIPLLMRILKDKLEFTDLVSKVFTFDYIGALLASLLFPLVLVPHLGLVRSGFFFGMMNVLVAFWALFLLGREIPYARLIKGSALIVLLILAAGFVYSDRIMGFAESASYADNVIYARSSRYQRIVLTKSAHDLRLFLNGNLQFSSRDEYRYHEALVHPGLAGLKDAKDVLILGGGDGFAAREILKYPGIRSITLVDLDPSVTELFTGNPQLSALNGNALNSDKVHVINADAFVWIRDNKQVYDFVVVDFPDPSNFSIGKLYSNSFYRELFAAVSEEGRIVIQSTSPFVAKKSFWCVDATLRSVGFKTTAYHAYVPSFGEWGYVLAGKKDFVPSDSYPAGLKFVDQKSVEGMLYFPDDMKVAGSPVNKLNNQILVHLFEDEWAQYVQ